MAISLAERSRAHASTRTRKLARLLVVTPVYPWPINPYEGIFVQRQVERLAALGHECRVLNFRGAIQGLPRRLTALSWMRADSRWMGRSFRQEVGVSYRLFPRQPGADIVPEAVAELTRFIKRHEEYRKTDLIYAHWLWSGGAVGLGIGAQFGWPVAAIARGSELHRWQSIHRHCRGYVEQVIGKADLLLANCQHLGSRIAAMDGSSRQRLEIVYNGCDAEAFQPARDRMAVRARLGLRRSSRYMLICASVAKHKGLTELAGAWRSFARSRSEWKLLVLGGIVESDQAALLRRVGGPSVSLLGQKTQRQVSMYMQAADVYVQPSQEEGLANATMEAMASALPVISSNAGGQSELIRDGVNGWLVPRCDEDALLDAMHHAAQDPSEASARGRRARSTILKRFDPEPQIHHLSRLLNDAARGSSERTVAGRWASAG